jgi:hypothetical protein
LLEVESAAQNNIYREFLERSKQTDTAVLFPATPVRVISRAVAPIRPAFPDNKLMIPAAGILSFVLSAGFAMFLERRKGLVSTGDVETMLGIPALGMLPLRTPKTEEMYQDVVEDVLSRLLYDHAATSVLVTSALPNEGKEHHCPRSRAGSNQSWPERVADRSRYAVSVRSCESDQWHTWPR